MAGSNGEVKMLNKKAISKQKESHNTNQIRGLRNVLDKGGKGTQWYKGKKMQEFIDKTGGKWPKPEKIKPSKQPKSK